MLWDLSEPVWDFVLLVCPHVKVDDNGWEKRRECNEDHVDAEERTCKTQSHSDGQYLKVH